MKSRYETALYKAYDADGALIYVGISGDWAKRLCQHRGASPWYYDIARLEVEWFSDRWQALAREKALIAEHEPKWNWAGTMREYQRRTDAR